MGNNERAVKFTVTVINDSDESVNTVDLTPSGDATFNDRKTETIFDSGSDCGDGGMESTTVLPGKKYNYDVAYAVGQKPGELRRTAHNLAHLRFATSHITTSRLCLPWLIEFSFGGFCAHDVAPPPAQPR